MKINYESHKIQPTFQAKVSERFINSMRGYINHGENRLQNNYKLTQKLEQYASFGHDDYTVEMHQKEASSWYEYLLIAVRDGETPDKGIVLAKTGSYKGIFKKFMTMRRWDFNNCFKNK